MKHLLRELPPVHELQKSDRFINNVKRFNIPETQITEVIQSELQLLRGQLLSENVPEEATTKQAIIEYIWSNVEKKLHTFEQDRLFRVINGTGTVLHTNLGRSRLSEEAIRHVAGIAGNYSNLEYQFTDGKRGSRHDILEDLLTKVTGAGAAMVVNNNAAAVLLVLRALAKEKEVIVSRGQLVEIGGSFRVSSIMEESGALIVEVGTTNKTHLYDYEHAIGDNTGMILKVHTSNFKTIGFTESVSTKELVELAKQKNVVFYEDLGSGSLYDFRQLGIGEEPLVKEVLASGVDLVSFSGDKLLGGPQAGIIAGKKELIQQLKRHQLARVLRVDKMTFAGLEKTLRAYLSEKSARELPTVRDIVKSSDYIRNQATSFIQAVERPAYELDLLEDISQIGGGTMPGVELPTYVVAITHKKLSAHLLAEKLRKGNPAVIARIKDERVLLDFRTISNTEMPELIGVFISIT
ncbi:L-seryl-tRNA(Sec) selenium transferase [Virgibacillus oceani]|uniref:L-seryl-tRNA(Sec) selenium transferase n=1 Tax=Virgibacillus oceani TaxID=1479511 RepID=A0A917M4G2_9BACI|nr:L-seryl-tRNA(Sec) selenium transferase [Virgibacillus oceani]GGG77241.1 L-seryl-tRNA(Sec) selenium transferase [Virgibacillus oceani]